MTDEVTAALKAAEAAGITVYGVPDDLTEADVRGLEKIKLICLTDIDRAGLREATFTASFRSFMGDRVQLRIAGMYWGERVGHLRVYQPASWWEMLKAQIYASLEPATDYPAIDEDVTPEPISADVEAALPAALAAVRASVERLLALIDAENQSDGQRATIENRLTALVGPAAKSLASRHEVRALFPRYEPPKGLDTEPWRMVVEP